MFSSNWHKTTRLFILLISLVIYKRMKVNELVGLNNQESIKVSACVLQFHLPVWKCKDKLWLFSQPLAYFAKFLSVITLQSLFQGHSEWKMKLINVDYTYDGTCDISRDILLNKYRFWFVGYAVSSPLEQRLINIWLLFLINRVMDFDRYFREVPERVQRSLEGSRTFISIFLCCLLLDFIIVTILLNV